MVTTVIQKSNVLLNVFPYILITPKLSFENFLIEIVDEFLIFSIECLSQIRHQNLLFPVITHVAYREKERERERETIHVANLPHLNIVGKLLRQMLINLN
jgi:hypothetical protein